MQQNAGQAQAMPETEAVPAESGRERATSA